MALTSPKFETAIIATIALVVLLPLSSGCSEEMWGRSKSLPAPLRHDFPYEVKDMRGIRPWGPEHFEIQHKDVFHYFVIRGLIGPKPGQSFYVEGRTRLQEILYRQRFDAVVYSRDEMQHEVGDVFFEGENIGLRMIREGYAWYDGTEFEGMEQYKQAQESAAEEKVGLWSRPDPVHPAVFLEEQKLRRGY